MSPFEIVMLICFGVSWPISIFKSLRTKIVSGKSPLFMGIVCLGYLAGIIHKYFYSFDWVIILYLINMLFVTTDLILYFIFIKHKPNDYSL